MHIEPGIVDGAKMGLAYATAAGAAGLAGKMAWDTIKRDGGVTGLVSRSLIGVAATLLFFEIMPHFPVGVSEVHFILGSTLLLMLGAGPAALGLMGGLLIQGLFFSPTDLPMYFVNVTTLVIPAFAIAALAKRIIMPGTAYKDVSYKQALALSTTYQGGIVAWVAFWAFYGSGFGAASSIMTFGAAYMLVVVIEPVLDLAVLAGAKALDQYKSDALVTRRLHSGAEA